ncbi:MAG: glycoside hydrolase family 31 protein [Muribaculaceae bacterium]|nr:glycoside hydrolase family 31 protein [Roseburia sp.]MCM1430171.1 glycoside hydrolase family 31 protein [Muribaculaceae bacterium]MCM1493101.1 glycoside hydrolase family 31 protein [Muribaculaceae bacterium]
MELGKIRGCQSSGSEVIIRYEKGEVIVSVITPEIVNVFVPCWAREHYSRAIEGEKGIPVVIAVQQEGETLTVTTDALRLTFGEDLAMQAWDASGNRLFATYDRGRTVTGTVDEQLKKLLEAEGHDTSNIGSRNYPVQLVCALDAGDDFYGLGDKTGYLNKKYYEYENWNSDIPQAHTEDFHALYKSIPFLICKKEKGVYGMFFDNTFHSYVNLGKEQPDYFYYGADDGNLDLYIIGGASMPKVVENYTCLTGRTPLPQLWTLGYQQSRWGYGSAEDMREIAAGMRENDIPCDVLHFDIDYMDAFKVFTWDEKNYGRPGELVSELGEKGIKVVTIIDPGTKQEQGYFMHDEGVENGYFATDAGGEVYVNVVWPGESNYPDFGRKEVRDWWGNHHKFLLDIGVAGIWNDMNEPASFRGELPGDVVFHDGERATTHAEMHNVYGHYMSKAAYEGLRRLSDKRPFVITRACYAGTQKYSTVWTGDNQSLWPHLQMMIPQLCNLGMSGFAFAGTDIGGFGADVTPELLIRWVEAAVFSPLFRNHSAKGTRRQEPWQFGQKTLDIYRSYVKLRYQFLPYLYDLFYQGESTGLPVMRPLVLHYEEDKNTRNLNGEFLVGENLLVAPVVEQGATKKLVYLPEGVWYDYWTGERLEGQQYILRDAPIELCPMYMRAGSMIPTYETVAYVGEKPYRRLTLLATPEPAEYVHFQDNGENYDYREGGCNLYTFSKAADNTLSVHMEQEGYPRYGEITVKIIGG